MCSIFTPPLPFGAVYFLKISKSFQFLTFQPPLLFAHKFKSPSDPSGASPFGQEGLATSYILFGPPRWAGLLHCSSLLWIRSSLTSSWLPDGESRPSSQCDAFLITCFRHAACAAFHSPGEISSTRRII